MCWKAYHKYDPGPSDKPKYARSLSMEYWKKAISYFMPNRLSAWNYLTNPPAGNPTKSKEVNDLINAVKKKETRKQGKKSKADRAMEADEFEQVIRSFESSQEYNRRHKYTAMLKMAFHFIARGDDTAHLKKENIEISSEFPWTLTAKFRWSKNVHEERDCPKQIMLGADDPTYCVLLALAIFLESWIENGGGTVGPWLFCEGDDTDGAVVEDENPEDDDEGGADSPEDSPEAIRTKNACSTALRNVFRDAAFVRAPFPEPLGMHSNKKYATTRARRCGQPRDDVDYRARWKIKRIQDKYADVTLPWPDVKVAAALCTGGPVKYKVKEGCGISDQWLKENVAPGIASQFSGPVAAVFAKPLLWAVYDPDVSSLVPASIRQRIVAAYNALGEDAMLADDQNPIEKVLLTCYESGGQVFIEEIPNDVQMAPPGGAGGNVRSQWETAMLAKVACLEQRMVVVQNNQTSHHAMVDRRLRNLEANTSRIALQPVARPIHGGGGGGGEARAPAATLAKPRDLYQLWQEYEFGIGGRKPARQFTSVERGAVKFTYSRRKIIWDAIDRMVRSGVTAQVAIDRIYGVYGRLNVSAMVRAMRQDERHGGHQQLR